MRGEDQLGLLPVFVCLAGLGGFLAGFEGRWDLDDLCLEPEGVSKERLPRRWLF